MMSRVTKAGVVVLGLFLAFFLAAAGFYGYNALSSAAQERAELRDSSKANAESNRILKAALELQNKQIEELGEEPIVESLGGGTDEIDTIGLRPTQGQVNSAVDAMLTSTLRESCGGDCKGEDAVALPPTVDALAAQVAALLPGALEANCGGSCKGDTGEKGESVTGDPGRGIVAVTCRSDGGITQSEYTIFYSDGTQETIVCEQLPPVEPTPTPGPTEGP